jgi:hypothetical protein
MVISSVWYRTVRYSTNLHSAFKESKGVVHYNGTVRRDIQACQGHVLSSKEFSVITKYTDPPWDRETLPISTRAQEGFEYL